MQVYFNHKLPEFAPVLLYWCSGILLTVQMLLGLRTDAPRPCLLIPPSASTPTGHSNLNLRKKFCWQVGFVVFLLQLYIFYLGVCFVLQL